MPLPPFWSLVEAHGDELLVHAPAEHGNATSRLVDDCLQEAAQRWAPGSQVRFIADTSVVRSWSDAKSAVSRPLDEEPII